MQFAELFLYAMVLVVLGIISFIMYQQYLNLKDQNPLKGRVPKKGRKAAKTRGYWGLE